MNSRNFPFGILFYIFLCFILTLRCSIFCKVLPKHSERWKNAVCTHYSCKYSKIFYLHMSFSTGDNPFPILLCLLTISNWLLFFFSECRYVRLHSARWGSLEGSENPDGKVGTRFIARQSWVWNLLPVFHSFHKYLLTSGPPGGCGVHVSARRSHVILGKLLQCIAL